MGGPSPFDFFYYRPYYSNYSLSNKEEMGFLESTFSYIFGDGNPNNNIEQQSISKIANFITNNNGAVTAEQIAPFIQDNSDYFLPSPPTDTTTTSSSNYVDESFVLPIVTKLNGIPEVTSDGDIIYIFPDLQLVSATSNTDSTYSTNKSIKKKEKDEEIFVLKQLGIDPNISTSQLKRIMIEGLGISTTIGALERNDLIQTFLHLSP